jgi:tetratricopeptide (TPR) repeat protein
LAIALEKCMNAHRLRWDEGYQDQLRELQDALREKPKDVARILAVGDFIYRESSMMGEQFGPGGPYHTFRYSGNGQANIEIADADAYYSDALAIDPQNAMAMTGKAAIQLEHGNWDSGEEWVNKALAIRSDIPELLELLTRVLDNAAATNAATAVDLRTAKSWWTYGVYYDTHWTRTPTQGELQHAAILEQKANAMWDRAERSLIAAVQAKAGTPDGYYFGGLLENRRNNIVAAVKNFELAAKAAPSQRNVEALVHSYAKAGRVDEAVTTQYNFTLTRQTTATPHLAAAWTHMENTAYKKTRASLESAIAVDPCDTRIPAYYASLAMIEMKPAEALYDYNQALAMEEAHQLFKGASLASGTAALTGDDVCLSMLLNLRASFRAAELHHPEDAYNYLKRNLAIEPRIPAAAWQTNSSFAVLPNHNDPKATTPRSIQNLLAWTHVMTGYNLLAQNKPDEAAAQFQVVWDWQHLPDLFEVQQLACAGTMRLRWSKDDPDRNARSQWLQQASIREGLSREEVDRINQIRMSRDDPNMNASDLQKIQNEVMPLYKYVWQPATPGGYDPKQNPNYAGTDDRGPDDAPRDKERRPAPGRTGNRSNNAAR